MDVTDVLRDRMQEPAGFQQMAAVAALIHVAALAALILAPDALFTMRDEEPRTVMTISLGGGAPGPVTGGMTMLGGRPVQVETPPEEVRRPEPVRPPAAKAPEMTMPTPNARRQPAASAEVKQAPEEARGRTPTRGEKTSTGSAVADTGARGQGFGLSSGGGAGSGVRLDVANFCCPDYITTMVERIRTNWDPRADIPGVTTMVFTIQRDGTITGVQVETPSRFMPHNLNAQRALVSTRTLPPLPEAFTNPTLTIHLNFEYNR